jgi:hypothetical protein
MDYIQLHKEELQDAFFFHKEGEEVLEQSQGSPPSTRGPDDGHQPQQGPFQ